MTVLPFWPFLNFQILKLIKISKFHVIILNSKVGRIAYKIKALKTARMQTFDRI